MLNFLCRQKSCFYFTSVLSELLCRGGAWLSCWLELLPLTHLQHLITSWNTPGLLSTCCPIDSTLGRGIWLLCVSTSFIPASSLFPPLRILRVSLIRASANAIVSLLHLLSHLPEPELPPSACYETNSNTSLQPSSLSWCLLLSPAYNLPQILTTAMQFEIFL